MISIIIPCYNAELFIARAINSVFSQSFKDWELILVNNNSTDGTQKILEDYQLKYPNNIKVFQEFKKGAPAARNKGLKEAKGEWIQFLDADDEILKDKLQIQSEIALKQQPALVASTYTIKGVRENKPFTRIRELNEQDFWKGLIHSKLGITSANLFNKNILDKVNGWDEDLVSSQEYDLMFRCLQVLPKVGFDSTNLTVINIEPGLSVSRGGGKEKGKNILESRIGLRMRIKEYLKDKNLLTDDKLTALDTFIFKQLAENYRFRSEYVRQVLNSTVLKVPFDVKLKGTYFMFKMDVKRVLKLK